MARVKGPNGLVYEIEDRVASGLVGKGNRGYEYAEKPASEAKKSDKPSVKK